MYVKWKRRESNEETGGLLRKPAKKHLPPFYQASDYTQSAERKEHNRARTKFVLKKIRAVHIQRFGEAVPISPIHEVFLQNHASPPKQLITQKPEIVFSRLWPQAQTATILCKTMLPHLCKTMRIMTVCCLL